MTTATDNHISFLTFTATTGLQPLPDNDVPAFLLDAVSDWVAGDANTFHRVMAKAGAKCPEWFGLSGQVLDVWKLPRRLGWYVLHFDPDAVADFHILIPDTASYVEFQAKYIAPIAMKIMAEDRQWQIIHEMNKEMLAAG